jgi:hypothetical protein
LSELPSDFAEQPIAGLYRAYDLLEIDRINQGGAL